MFQLTPQSATYMYTMSSRNLLSLEGDLPVFDYGDTNGLFKLCV